MDDFVVEDDVESEDEPTQDIRQRPTKHIRSSAYVEDSDNIMESGFESALLPPISRSLSPKPRRKAAKKAQETMVITVQKINLAERQSQQQSSGKSFLIILS